MGLGVVMAKKMVATFGKTMAKCPNCKSEKPKEMVSRPNKRGWLAIILSCGLLLLFKKGSSLVAYCDCGTSFGVDNL